MRDVFIVLNIFGALMIAVLMKVTTPLASPRAAFHDPQAMWGMLRRLFYISIAAGMLGKALWTAEGYIQPAPADMIFWLMIVTPLGLFILFRWLGFIDQDHWVGVRRRMSGARWMRPANDKADLRDLAEEWREIAEKMRDPDRKARAYRAAMDLEHIATL
jgi:hypothetical protein